MKWNPKNANVSIPASFLKAYSVTNTTVVTPENYLDYLL